MNVAVVLARGGSKRIPRKNIKSFNGKPIIFWPLKILNDSKIFDQVIVSTDDEEISNIAKTYGALVPFVRPKNLADDYSGTIEVVAHAVKWMEEQKWNVKNVCCVYATSVFLNIKDLQAGFETINSNKWKFVFSVTDYEYSIFRSFGKDKKGGVKMFYPEFYQKRSQDLPNALHDAAQFYWGKHDVWLDNHKIFDSHSFPLIIPRWRVQDIDTDDDWKRAEFLFKELN